MYLWIAMSLASIYGVYRQCVGKSSKSIPSNQYTTEKPYRIVIVGGSFAGLKCLAKLMAYDGNDNLDITLIEPKQYMEYTPSIIHAMLNPEKFQSISIPMSEIVVETPRCRWIRGSVTAVNNDSVSIAIHSEEFPETRVLPYDCIFLAHGSQYASPIKTPTASLPTPLIEDILATTPSSASADSQSLSTTLASLPGDLRLAAFLAQYSPLPPPRPLPGSVSQASRALTLQAFRTALLFGRDATATRQVIRDRAMATGSDSITITDSVPLFRAEDEAAFDTLPAIVSRVRIIGAGLVGVELAAEIAQYLQEYMQPHHRSGAALAPFIDAAKQAASAHPGLLDLCASDMPLVVELHTNMDSILTGFPTAVVNHVTNWLRAHGVTIVVNSAADLKTLASDHGDMVCVCAGVTPSVVERDNRGGRACDDYSDGVTAKDGTETKSDGESAIDLARGFIACESSLLTKRTHAAVEQWLAGDRDAPLPPLCFAIGDACSNAEGGKMALTAETQAVTAVHNLVTLLQAASSKEKCELVTYPEWFFQGKPPFLCCISLGTQAGVTVFNDFWFSGPLAVYLKAFIEWSKVRERSGWSSMSLLWSIGDTASVWANVGYKAVASCFSKSKSD